jgi:hypothetical protein
MDSGVQDTALPYAEGDDVHVTGLDGETGRARVVDLLDEPAGEHVLFEDSGDPVTVADYWGRTVDGDETVVRVQYTYENDEGELEAGGQAYDFPESAVEVREPDGETAEDTDADADRTDESGE